MDTTLGDKFVGSGPVLDKASKRQMLAFDYGDHASTPNAYVEGRRARSIVLSVILCCLK